MTTSTACVKPLPPACIAAFHAGVDEMAKRETFKGYGPEQGYAFLRELIAQHEFKARGAQVDADEIFVSDSSKCDIGNIQELFATDIRVGIPQQRNRDAIPQASIDCRQDKQG